MKNKATYIIGSVLLLTSGVLVAHGFSGTNYPKQIESEINRSNELYKESDKHLEEARRLSCENIGNLYQKCFHRKASPACGELNLAEQDYATSFSGNAWEQCGQGVPEAAPSSASGTSVSSSSVSSAAPKKETNPLFFGDEGKGQ